MIPVIMSGGSGTRLWPLSRSMYPKQFLPLASEHSMLQETLLRLQGLDKLTSSIIIGNENHRFLIAEQLRVIDQKASIILEPAGRNTAPAVALAALHSLSLEQDPVLLILAADHVIQNKQAFQQAVAAALPHAEQGKLITFGIVPNAPETGYGYIRQGDALGADTNIAQVAQFVEKPSLEVAEQYLASGEYLWNSGMFMFRASRYLEELESHRPDILAACQQAFRDTATDLDFIRVNKEAFEACPEDSIDYAVMEKTDAAVVVPLDANWSDVGSWSALWEVGQQDENGNVTKGDVLVADVKNSYLHSEDSRLISAVGLEDVVVVDTKDAVLVAHKNKVQDVKSIVNQLKKAGRGEYEFHREVYRPWGKYDSIDNGERYQVKRITVKPGAKLSVQMHHHRAEHWIVVSGTAKVTNGDKDILLTENQSTYIPVGVIHALENPGKIPLELIEVQSGSYLGEDDIVRFEDRYGRT